MEPLMGVKELGALLGMTPAAVRMALSRRRIPQDAIIRYGRRVRFDPVRVRTWVESMRGEAACSAT